MTLTEFLLARIAEDEADIAGVQRWLDRESRRAAPESVVVMTRNVHPAFLRAECEAKRRIVERCAAIDYAMPSAHLAHGILAELALPYADHEDFQEEWRV